MSIRIAAIPLSTIWAIRKEVMYPELEIEAVQLPDDDTGLHLGLYHNGQLCSVISLFESADALQFRKFATLNHLQGKGYGSLLLQAVFEQAREKGMRRIWCNARLSAQGFYQRFGMEAYGDTWEQQGHQFIQMQIFL